MQLTTSFASPSFLLAEESNHGLLGSLLDTVCSILYYQASSTIDRSFCSISNERLETITNRDIIHAL